jgi:hypothetical protein
MNHTISRGSNAGRPDSPSRHRGVRGGALPAWACILTLAVLSGCAYPPAQGAPGQILSRLPAGAPGAAPAAPQLTQAEKDRYKQIDQQVMDQQDQLDRARAWAEMVEATPVYYSGYAYETPYPYAPYPVEQIYPIYPVYPAGYGYGYGYGGW